MSPHYLVIMGEGSQLATRLEIVAGMEGHLCDHFRGRNIARLAETLKRRFTPVLIAGRRESLLGALSIVTWGALDTSFSIGTKNSGTGEGNGGVRCRLKSRRRN